MNSAPHIVLAGGGTAGHVNPLLSVADALRRQCPQVQLSVVGTAVGLEHDLVPAAGLPLDVIEKVPFPRRLNRAALAFPRRWHRQKAMCREILQRRHADVVVGFGGYASAPVYSAAQGMGIPIAIHEQNVRAGMANRLGARWAQYVATAYEHTGFAARSGQTVERIGLPLRPAIAQLCDQREHDAAGVRERAAQALGLDPGRPVVVVTGGSLGAVHVNVAVASSADALLRVAQVVHLTGKGKAEQVRQLVSEHAGEGVLSALGERGGDYHVAEYSERIDLAFACADLVICRSGAGTVNELSALGLPAVYVPLPIGNGEQRFNAQPVVQAGGGVLVEDAEFTDAWVRDHVLPLLSDAGRLAAMGRASWEYGVRDAAQVMADRVLHMVK